MIYACKNTKKLYVNSIFYILIIKIKFNFIIEYIYKKYAGSKNKELIKIKFINLEEFKYFVVDAQVFQGDLVTEREIN